jgi:hypothetical protein
MCNRMLQYNLLYWFVSYIKKSYSEFVMGMFIIWQRYTPIEIYSITVRLSSEQGIS